MKRMLSFVLVLLSLNANAQNGEQTEVQGEVVPMSGPVIHN